MIGEPASEIPVGELPGFEAPTALGHGGTIRSVEVGGKKVLVVLGRTHGYEGKGVQKVVHGVRTAAAAGVSTIVLTNAAGGLRQGMSVGQPVLISDHLNLTSLSPLVGARFVDLTDLYSLRLRDLARSIDPSLDEGVYCQFRGPQYETPAEVRMAKTIGGHIVGMSTALEAIAAPDDAFAFVRRCSRTAELLRNAAPHHLEIRADEGQRAHAAEPCVDARVRVRIG